MNRIITGQAAGRRMTIGELRRFLESVDGADDDTPVKAKVAVRGYLRAVTIEERLKDDASAEDVLFGRNKDQS